MLSVYCGIGLDMYGKPLLFLLLLSGDVDVVEDSDPRRQDPGILFSPCF